MLLDEPAAGSFFVCPVHIFILTYRSGNAMKVTNDMSVFAKVSRFGQSEDCPADNPTDSV